MKRITTKSGFKLELDERILDDWRVVKALGKADDDKNPGEMLAASVELVGLIFGKDEERLMEHIKEKNDGFVPTTVIKEELLSVFTRLKSLKNSQSSPG